MGVLKASVRKRVTMGCDRYDLTQFTLEIQIHSDSFFMMAAIEIFGRQIRLDKDHSMMCSQVDKLLIWYISTFLRFFTFSALYHQHNTIEKMGYPIHLCNLGGFNV